MYCGAHECRFHDVNQETCLACLPLCHPPPFSPACFTHTPASPPPLSTPADPSLPPLSTLPGYRAAMSSVDGECTVELIYADADVNQEACLACLPPFHPPPACFPHTFACLPTLPSLRSPACAPHPPPPPPFPPLCRAAISSGDGECIVELINAGADVNQETPRGTALTTAAALGDVSTIALLVRERGAGGGGGDKGRRRGGKAGSGYWNCPG